MATLYGIPNCDTLRRARRWLDERGIEYRFHDYKKQGLEPERLLAWEQEFGWEALVNRRGATWRNLPDAVRKDMDRETAIRIMQETPVLIRRPLLDRGETRLIGFSEAEYEELFR